jgi:K319-like protein
MQQLQLGITLIRHFRRTGLFAAAALAGLAGPSAMAAGPPCAPEAQIAPANQVVNEDTLVQLNGNPSKDETSYAWAQTAGPSVTLSSTTAAMVMFTAPAVGPAGATLKFTLRVTGCSPAITSAPAETTIAVLNVVNPNQPPVASSTVSPASIYTGDTVTLDGSGSSDPDGDTLTYAWVQIDGTAVVLSNANAATATFTAPFAPYPGGTSLKFRLTVSDDSLQASTEQIVNVLWQNAAPTAEALCPVSVDENGEFWLDGRTSTDPDDGIAAYSWTQTLGGPVALLPTDTTTALITATAPPLLSPLDTMSFKLDVTDLGGLEDDAECAVKVNDITPPEADPTQSPAANTNGWNNSDVTVTWDWFDAGVGIDEANCPESTTSSGEGDPIDLKAACSDLSGNGHIESYPVKVDKTKPTVSAAAISPPNGNGWYRNDVTVHFTCDDNLSGFVEDACPVDQTLSAEGSPVSSTAQAVSDKAGNLSDPSNLVNVNIDKTAPGIDWDGDIDDGDSFYFGSVPAAPTCAATDGLSGPEDCAVTGYGDAVGNHTLTATAHDKAGNESKASRSYTVKAWTLAGFYQPVDMGGVSNTVKGGSTVPLKFEVFAANELTDVSVVDHFIVAKVACQGSSGEDPIEMVTTGGTSLRYDSLAGQFIQNWQTPKAAGTCYLVTMFTDDGSSLSANFKLK